MAHPSHDHKMLARLVVLVSTIGGLIAICFLGALHSPEPNDVDLGVVGPAEATAPVERAIEGVAPGKFDITTYATREEAGEAIQDREITAAFEPAPGKFHLYVAGAGGAMAKNNMVQLGDGLAAHSGSELVVEDLVPLPEEDRAGLSPFLLVVSILIPSLVMGVLISLVASGATPRAKLVAALGGGALLGGGNTLVANGLFGAFSGHYWELAGVATLASWAITLPMIALHRLLGAPGVGITALLFMVFGVPATGAAIGPEFIPDAFQAFTLAFPAGEAIPAVRNIAYFGGADTGLNLLLLSTWACVGALVLAVRRRNQPSVPDPAHAPQAG